MSNRCCYKSKKNTIKIITKTKINMAAKSEKLDSHLESHQTESVREKLAWLKALGIDAEVFAKFHDKIEGILEKSPGSEDVVAGEIGKLWLVMENTMSAYWRTFRSIISDSANNLDYNWPDESLVS